MKNLFVRWLKVYEDEIGLFCGMALLLFFINSSSIILNNFVETAFLKRYGVQYLPMITAVNAVVTFFLLNSLSGIISKVRGDKMIGRTLILSGALIGLLRFVLPFGFDLLYPILYVLKTQFTVLLAFLFWNLANDLFSTRQSKRIFPLITTGGIIGGITGSFATPILARLVSSDNLLLLFTVFSVAGAMTVWQMGARIPSSTLKEPAKAGGERLSIMGEFQKVIPLIKKSTLAQVLLLLTLLPNLVIPILNYQFSFVVDQTFVTEAGMLSFYSYFRGAQNFIALLLSLFVGRIYGRFGLPIALMFHPVNYLIAFAAYLFQFNIFSAVYAGTSVSVIRTTINGPATSALYGLLLPKDRTVLRTFLRGTVVRISILAGSAILWVGAPLMPPRYLSLLAVVFVAAWLGSTFMLKRRYSTILINLLRGELPDFYRIEEGDLKALFKGVDVGPMLLQKFRGSTGQEAVWYAEAMHTQGVEALDAAILDKLAEADDATRLGLLPYLSEKAGRPAIDAFRKLIDPEKPELMVALARSAKRVYPDMPETMEKEIFDKARNPEVKACFLGWLRKHEPKQAAELISGWLGSETLAERRAGVLALRESDRAEDMESLRHLLEVETDPSIIVLGLRVFSAMEAPDLVDQILPFLKHTQETVRLASVEALSPGNEQAILALIIAMGDPSNAVRNRAIQRLEDIPLSLLPVLVAELGSHSRRVRDGLFQLTRTLDAKDLDVSRFCQGQLKIAYEALAQAEALEQTSKTDAKELLVKHLDELADVRVENVVNGLAAWDATGQIGMTLRGLRSDDERARGDSLEALDALLDRSLTRLLIPLLEKQPREMKLAAGRGSLDQSAVSIAEVGTAIERFLKDPDWVTTILTIDDLVTWGQVDEYRSLIEPLVTVKSKPLSAMAAKVLGEGRESGTQPMSLSERTLKLSQIDLFRSLSVNQLVEVASVTEEVRFAPETEISFDDEANRGLHLIVAGEVSAEQERPDSQAGAAELARFGPGQSIGIAMLFGMSPHSLKIRILQESVMLRISTQTFLAMAKDAPVISLEVARVLCERLGLAIEILKKESKTPLIESSGAPAGLVGNALPDRVDDAANEQIKIFKRVAQLRQIDLFRDLSAHHLATIAVVAEEVLLTPESVVFSDDVPCRGLYLIVAGEVAIEQDRPDNQAGAVQLTRFGPGQVLALGALFGMKMSGLKARTLCETEALVITKGEFYAIAMEHPDIALRTCQVLSERLGGVIQELERKDG